VADSGHLNFVHSFRALPGDVGYRLLRTQVPVTWRLTDGCSEIVARQPAAVAIATASVPWRSTAADCQVKDWSKPSFSIGGVLVVQ